MPERPRGVIFLFHGSGGAETYATNAATQEAIAPLMAAGYGFAASASAQRAEPRRWDLSTHDPVANADIAFMLAFYTRLVESGEIAPDTPVFTMGMSNGGGMANLFAMAALRDGLPVRAVANYMGPFPASMQEMVAAGVRPPATFAVAGERDGLVSAAAVMAGAARLKELGVPVEARLVREGALTASVFAIPGAAGAEAGQEIFGRLVRLGIVDTEGRRLFRAGQAVITRDDQAALRALLASAGLDRRVERLLLIGWGAHQMRGDLAAEQLAFFESALSR